MKIQNKLYTQYVHGNVQQAEKWGMDWVIAAYLNNSITKDDAQS